MSSVVWMGTCINHCVTQAGNWLWHVHGRHHLLWAPDQPVPGFGHFVSWWPCSQGVADDSSIGISISGWEESLWITDHFDPTIPSKPDQEWLPGLCWSLCRLCKSELDDAQWKLYRHGVWHRFQHWGTECAVKPGVTIADWRHLKFEIQRACMDCDQVQQLCSLMSLSKPKDSGELLLGRYNQGICPDRQLFNGDIGSGILPVICHGVDSGPGTTSFQCLGGVPQYENCAGVQPQSPLCDLYGGVCRTITKTTATLVSVPVCLLPAKVKAWYGCQRTSSATTRWSPIYRP